MLTSPKTVIEIEAYVDFLPENNKKGGDMSTVFNDQDNDCDKNRSEITVV